MPTAQIKTHETGKRFCNAEELDRRDSEMHVGINRSLTCSPHSFSSDHLVRLTKSLPLSGKVTR